MAYINIPIKDNSTPLSPTEFNYLVDKLNARKLRDLIDVQDSDPLNGNTIRHNGSGWVYYNINDDYYTKSEVNDAITQGVIAITPTDYDYIDFVPQTSPITYKEGRMYYDFGTKGWILFNNEPNIALNLGEEQRVPIINSTLGTIFNGEALTVVGTGAGNRLLVDRAIASDRESALNTIGIATHDIEAGGSGYATTSGSVRDVNTSSYTEGAAIWLSDTVAGAYQLTRPESPSYEVRMGGVIKQDIAIGEIYAEIRIISNDHDINKFYNGTILEDYNVNITTTPTVTTLNVVEYGSKGYLSVIFNQEFTKIFEPINIVLTNGTDTVPVENFIYINNLGVITVSLSGFPTTQQYAPIATAMVQSAASVNTYGVYKIHALTNELSGSNGQGHLSHLNNWIRKRPVTWESGVVLSTTIGSALPTIPIAYSSGSIYQLHPHVFPAFDTATGSSLYGINDFTTPYIRRTSISNSIDTDSLGNAIGNNKYYNLVIWGVVSEEESQCKVMYNLPSGSYTNATDALNDIEKTANFTIPIEYLGTGFLITSMVIKRMATNVEIITDSIKDLRGLFPATGAGGGTTGGASITKWTELSDTPLAIEALKTVRGNADGTSLEFWDSEAAFTKNSAFNKNFSTIATDIKMNGSQGLGVLSTLARADHIHPSDTSREAVFSKNTAFNKNFGAIAGTVAEGDDSRITNGQTAFGWGDHSVAGYLTSVLNASSTVYGLTKLFSNTIQTVAATAVSATGSRTYGIQVNASGQTVVNVPWTNTTYSVITDVNLSNISSTTGGLITGQRINTWANSRGLTTTAIANWNTAFGWGDHAGLYSPLAHTHTFASLTSKPTTIGGYGITDFNSLGDARWALISSLGTMVTKGSGSSVDNSIMRADGNGRLIQDTGALATISDAGDVTASGIGKFANLEFTDGTSPFILGNATTGLLTLASDNSIITGSGIRLYASTHATKAKDIDFVSNGSEVGGFDNSIGRWIFRYASSGGNIEMAYGKLILKGGYGGSGIEFASSAGYGSTWTTTLYHSGGLTSNNAVTLPTGNGILALASTTIGGYGITDFNSLGDARWSLLAHTHTFASLTSKPTTISGYGITNAYTKTEADNKYLLNTTDTLTGNLTVTGGTINGNGSGLTAVDAETLDSLDSTQFLRSDVAATKTSGALIMADNVRFNLNTTSAIFASGADSYWDLLTADLIFRDGGAGYATKFTLSRTTGNFTNTGAIISQGTGSSSFLGNVGIGTTSPNAKFQVVGGSDVWSGIALKDGGTNIGQVEFRVSDNGTRARISNGYVNDANGDSLGFGVFQTGTINDIMTLRGNGNVGIGTTNPLEAITVSGQDKFIASSQPAYPWGGVNTLGVKIGTDTIGGLIDFRRWLGIGTNHGTAVIAQDIFTDSYGLDFRVDTKATNTEATTSRMFVGINGIGINHTAPTEKLHIRGIGTGIKLFSEFAAESESATTLNHISFQKHVTGGPSETIQIYNVGTFAETGYSASDLRFAFNDNFNSGLADKVTFKWNGNVGIGTTAPKSKLNVAGATSHTIIDSGDSDTVPFLAATSYVTGAITNWASATFGFGFFYRTTDGNLQLDRKNNSTTANQVLTIKRTDGNVGIGTTNPLSLLSLGERGSTNGDLRLSAAGSGANEGASILWDMIVGGGNPISHIAEIRPESYATGVDKNILNFYVGGWNNNQDSGTAKMTITSDGYVGIGTTSPSEIFHVSQPATSGWSGRAIFGNGNKVGLIGTYNNNVIIGGHSTALNAWQDVYLNTTNGSDGNRVFTNSLTIGSTSTANTLDVTGTGRFTEDVTANNFILYSDKRLKENIVSHDSEKRINIEIKDYELKSEKGVKRVGVIAQELEVEHPEFVRTDDEGIKSVAYIDLLMAKIAELEARLEKAGL